MSIRGLAPRSIDDIELKALSPTEWTVCDRRIAEDDARSVLGFLEKSDVLYEVTEFADPVRFHFFRTLDAVLAHFTLPTATESAAQPEPAVRIVSLTGA